jgi:hypothetical protein
MEKPVSTDGSVPIEESSKSSTKQGTPPPEKPAQPGGEPASEPVEGSPTEGAWKEDYDDVIEPSEEERVQAAPETSPKEKPKKKHWAGIITVIVIILLLLLWTLLSPKVMSPQGTTYVNSTAQYASLGNFTGERNIWTGDVTWGVSVGGKNNTNAGTPIDFKVLITKVSESPSNFFFRGIGISITNCTLWDLNGTYIAKFSSLHDLGFGKMAIINTTLPVGNHDLYVSVKFTEYEVMRLGFIPLESVQVEKVFLSSIHISP